MAKEGERKKRVGDNREREGGGGREGTDKNGGSRY